MDLKTLLAKVSLLGLLPSRNIDSLEIYTQQELIPNGFEDVSTVKHQGLDFDDLVTETKYKGLHKGGVSAGNRHIREIKKLSDQALANKMLNNLKGE